MIKLNNLDKYFNRKKSNEIHVINNISLSLPEKGLVVLLGPSGSGKTTLLNVLGGLDKVHKGTIDFGDKTIEKYRSKVWDEVRNKDVGYIFQNYNLLHNLTVYDNIALTLNMIGVVDKEEIDTRIDYILENIGMGNYRKRRASQLSGGQQQRVAIARALAKNPRVIIADEPTGNLDSKNTADIMNIIKNISKTKLVVLVTHEENLADFYADRVIKLKDGVIIEDKINDSSLDLDLRHDTDIYLKDLNQLLEIEKEKTNLVVYSDEEIDPSFELKLIIKNKTVYLDIDTGDYKKIQLLNKESEVNVYDSHFKAIKRNQVNGSDFDLNSVASEEKTIKRKSVITVKDSLKIAYKRLQNKSKFGKLLYLGYVASAILIAIAIAVLSNIFYISPNDYLIKPKETIEIKYDDFTYQELLNHEDESSIDYLNFLEYSQGIDIILPDLYQSRNNTATLVSNPVLSDYLDDDDIIHGRNVEDYNEIVIDKLEADNLLRLSTFQQIGVDSYKDLLELKIEIYNLSPFSNFLYEIEIVGISDTENPVYYVKEATMYMMETGLPIYDIFEDSIIIVEGTAPIDNDGMMLLHDYDLTEQPDTFTFGDVHDVTGTYSILADDAPEFLFSLGMVKELVFDLNYDSNQQSIYIHSNDKDKTIEYFKDLGITATDIGQERYDIIRSNRLIASREMIIITIVVMSASSISFLFIIRSSLLSRIYEISVYRALGVSKGDIRKMFLTEIILITSITSLVGYLATSWGLLKIQQLATNDFMIFHVSILSLFSGIFLIYATNILSGIIPVSNLLRRTPAEILSKYDF